MSNIEQFVHRNADAYQAFLRMNGYFDTLESMYEFKDRYCGTRDSLPEVLKALREPEWVADCFDIEHGSDGSYYFFEKEGYGH